MIFRRRANDTYSKLHLRLFSLHRTLLPWYSTEIIGCRTKEFLCPRIRAIDWRISTPKGEDIERWFYQYGKGNYCITVETAKYDDMFNFISKATISCTDRNTALMFKLQMGGR